MKHKKAKIFLDKLFNYSIIKLTYIIHSLFMHNIMGYINSKLSTVRKSMMFDTVYEGMSDVDVAGKYCISESKLRLIKNNKVWKLEERQMWDEMIVLLLNRRNVNAVINR